MESNSEYNFGVRSSHAEVFSKKSVLRKKLFDDAVDYGQKSKSFKKLKGFFDSRS